MIIFWVEVSLQIGMGHFYESLELAQHLLDLGESVHFILNPYHPASSELHKRKISFTECDIDAVDEIVLFSHKVRSKCVIINHRSISLNTLKRLNHENQTVVLIDQLGGKQVICDLLINRSIVPEWLNYDFEGHQPICCFGGDYAILDNTYESLHKREKAFPENENTVLVSMGGVDRTGATLRIIEAMKSIGDVSKEIIIGSGFSHNKKLRRIRENLCDSSFNFSQGVEDLGKRMSNADIVISAGGNTIYEMACVGAPGIVLWEDEHEYVQGKSFDEIGVVQCLGNGISTSIAAISDAIVALLMDINRRKHMSLCGKEIVDAEGKKRITSEILKISSLR